MESQNTTPSRSTGERPVRTARYMAILLSFNLFPFVATSYFTPGRVTLDEILSDTAFHTLSGFYIPRYSLFASGCGSNLPLFTAGASAFPSGFLEVYPIIILYIIVFRRLATKIIQTTIVIL